jgi:Mrp family chromosome partitioning ATPase
MLEFDLRKPHVQKICLSSDEGCTILEGNSGINNLLFEVKGFDGFLSLLPAGNVTSNPAELISGPNVPRLMKVLQERFDYVIINTPPLGLVADATLLQQYADMTLIVLRQGHTSREVYTDLNHRKAKDPQLPIYPPQ